MHRIAYRMRFKPSYRTLPSYASPPVPRFPHFQECGGKFFYCREGVSLCKRIVSTGALVLGFAFASVPALAQNMQGPGAPNFGLTSNPQTGGAINTAPTTISP
jgi:hypothetical protein